MAFSRFTAKKFMFWLFTWSRKFWFKFCGCPRIINFSPCDRIDIYTCSTCLIKRKSWCKSANGRRNDCFNGNIDFVLLFLFSVVQYTRCLIVNPPPPKPHGELIKKVFFSNFFFFFTFARKTKKITCCFLKKFDENLHTFTFSP